MRYFPLDDFYGRGLWSKSAGQLKLEDCIKVARENFIIGFLWMAGFTVSLLGPVKWFGVE